MNKALHDDHDAHSGRRADLRDWRKSMSDNVAVNHPDVNFVRPCNLCPHMKRITLGNIRTALQEMRHEITINPAIADDARRAVERMLAV